MSYFLGFHSPRGSLLCMSDGHSDAPSLLLSHAFVCLDMSKFPWFQPLWGVAGEGQGQAGRGPSSLEVQRIQAVALICFILSGGACVGGLFCAQNLQGP